MRPDALYLPRAVKTGGRIFDRVAAVCRIAEPLLEVDYAGGERAYIRDIPNSGKLFITRDPADTIFFPTGHPRSGQQRYRWIPLSSPQGVPMADGTELGYLTDA